MLSNLFKKNSYKALESFYLKENSHENLKNYSWLALAVNQRTIGGSMLTKELVLSQENPKSPNCALQLAELEKGIIHNVFFGSKKIYNGEMLNDDEIKNTRVLFNNLLDAFIEKEIKFFSESMNKSEFSPRQLEAEEKALEWMRVSFEVLTKAVMESLTNPEFLFQTTFFAGINPKSGRREMRLMTFNLDMTFLLLDDNNLRILIYNKKPTDKPEDLKPALMGDYSFRKREMFDQFIGLLSALRSGLHA